MNILVLFTYYYIIYSTFIKYFIVFCLNCTSSFSNYVVLPFNFFFYYFYLDFILLF